LAESLAALAVQVRFVTDRQTLQTVSLLADGPFEVIVTEPSRAAMATDVVIFDGYAFDRSIESQWDGFARLRVAIDDLADRVHACDVLVDHGAGRREADYAGLVPAHCAVLAGPSYAVLRGEFRAERHRALARRSPRLPRRVLISMGLTDVGGITRRVVEGVLSAGLGLAMDVVTGQTAASLPWLREQAAGGVLQLHVDLPGPAMAELMVDADMAIGAGGGTSLERCCMGLPSLVILLADNQLPSLSAQVRAGAASLIGDLGQATAQHIAAAIRDFAQDPVALAARAGAGAAMVDGAGADRVAQVILDRLAAIR
jgi:UDP-2,4-diacetamido-2,4,6-trideoxy-beta-L-altropyranose hydrolase